MSSKVTAAVMVAAGLLAGCGGAQTVRGEVVEVNGEQVCIEDEWTGRECLGPEIPGTQGLAVGDCVESTHIAESARISEVARC